VKYPDPFPLRPQQSAPLRQDFDTGDFLADYVVDPVLRNDWSFVFLVEVGDRGLYKLRLIPVVLHYAQVDLAKGEEFAAICHRMQSLCAAFNTNVIQTAEGLEVKLRTEKVLIPVL
jgi:hypothetical protein